MHSYETKILKGVIYTFAIIATFAAIYLLPTFAKPIALRNPEYAFYKWPILIFLYATLLPFTMILIKGHEILNLLDHKKAFSEKTLKALLSIEHYAAIIAIWYAIGILLLLVLKLAHPYAMIVCAIVIFTGIAFSFFSRLLRQILAEALAMKNENDLTI